MEVLERDELGLVDALVVEELLQWSDEDAGCDPENGMGAYSHSPDSDDGIELATGDSVMEEISRAFSMRLASRDLEGAIRHKSAEEAVEQYIRPEDAQAAALLGQPSFASDALGEVEADANINNNSENIGTGRWQHRCLPRRGASATRSSCSVEEALKIHALSLRGSGSSSKDGSGRGLRGDSSSGSSFSGAASPPSLDTSPQVSVLGGEGRGGVGNQSKEGNEIATSPSSRLATLPFTIRNAPLLRIIPKFYGVLESDGRVLLELEDLARWYHHPCIMDIKIGHRTWYTHADPDYIARCKKKDCATTQASLGFKICGMQVFRHGRGGYWRASKRWCKTLPELLVDKALTSFAHNGE